MFIKWDILNIVMMGKSAQFNCYEMKWFSEEYDRKYVTSGAGCPSSMVLEKVL